MPSTTVCRVGAKKMSGALAGRWPAAAYPAAAASASIRSESRALTPPTLPCRSGSGREMETHERQHGVQDVMRDRGVDVDLERVRRRRVVQERDGEVLSNG